VTERTGVRLADLTTLRLGGPARALVEAATDDDLLAVVRDLDRAGEPLLVVGGGSNLVVGDGGFDGTVVRVATRGTALVGGGRGTVEVRAAAGEPWDDVVATTVSMGLVGLEALSGIPGLVGATPIQNVGAYGQEVSQVVTSVEVLDRRTGSRDVLEPARCRFGYRTSALRGASRWVVLGVTFALAGAPAPARVAYAEVADRLGVPVGTGVPVADVREAVLAVRRAKGMVLDPADPDTTSAGSFFTNPVVAEDALGRVPPEAPRYPAAGGMVKLSAAWLIERAGFPRGFGRGAVRISGKHTLALTTRDGASSRELLGLAAEIRDAVAGQFGVVLVPEPVLVGCSMPPAPDPR
jgi:UDP-N-acetylmuramate dehydrogenase